MPSRLTRAYDGATRNPAGAIALIAGVAGLAFGVARYFRARDRRPTEDTLPADDNLEAQGGGIISETEDFTTPGTVPVDLEVRRAVTPSADSAEGAAHVPGGDATAR